MKKSELIKKVEREASALANESLKVGGFKEYPQLCEELLIKILPYVNKEGLELLHDEIVARQRFKESSGAEYDVAAAMRKLRKRRLSEGKCMYCEEPLETKTMCTEHAARVRKKAQDRAEQKLAEAGIKVKREVSYADSPKRASGRRYPLARRSAVDPSKIVDSNWRKER